ncbi:DMT family transporter [Ignatzschineria cameli]|uniref:EamA/RhaT family transporter n=1 Tax=Ignatzschineria cameli TaxID=2182793 RepID=A0A2U2AS06_9GAMM|nr:DMT family transporter [Ignatzschineria cameli]PWD86591.1 EamA/RhaT family transporter [Ignatzschineria cameli]PWD87056.1 EamA/RhaT family transporter [Ignatzschineria cameli]PWD92029.1 EamA/RhaT family transporter [Ignatzschineria cameli]PWD93386.1 EamA/RhaT family transporter [Ignatzschineria cameli]PWD94128.1 EamA/RhaT family transporter [Ignatzschineria cameli]
MNRFQYLLKRYTESKEYSLHGAIWMLLAGIAFAGINVITPLITEYYLITSSWIAFYQYLFALLFMAPFFLKLGIKRILYTHHFMTHFWRILVAVIGIQFWVYALSIQFPIGEGVALLMTSPLFASLGAFLFLRERFTAPRVIATILGFIGAIIILAPNQKNFNHAAIYPLLAALFWALHALLMKHLSDKDHPLTMVSYLYLLMVPINLFIALTDNFSHLPDHLFIPNIALLLLLLLLGFLTAIAQYAVAKAYSHADVIFIQPFDYFKLPLNTFLGFIIFGWAVTLQFWFGAFMMVSALLAISYFEIRKPAQDEVINR